MIQNRYLIVQLIGKGGMGEVYLAVDQRLGSAVALKRTFFSENETLGSAFEREARILARLRHPVLPKVIDHFAENNDQFLVMEHISGDDLAKRLEVSNKPFPISWVMFWADQMLDALNYLHSHEPPIVHRDIKPQNLKLTDDNHIVLLDFGLSKDFDSATTGGSLNSASVAGYSPHFASMEQIRGTGTDARSDIFSLSATLYQLLTNTVPIDVLARADALISGAKDPIVSPTEINPEVSVAISDVILKGVAVRQDERYSSAVEMQRILRRAFNRGDADPDAPTEAFSASDNLRIAAAGGAEVTEILPKVNETAEAIDVEKTQALPVVGQVADVSQADLKTEAFNADDHILPEEPAKPTAQAAPTAEMPAMPQTPPAATREVSAPEPPPAATREVSAPAPPPAETREVSAMGVAAGASSTAAPPTAAPVVAKVEPKKSSKAGLVIGLLIGLLAITAVAGVGGWFAYTKYSAGAVEPTASPTPDVVTAPSPAATVAEQTKIEEPAPSPEDVTESETTEANTDRSPSSPTTTGGPVATKPGAPPPTKANPAVPGKPAPPPTAKTPPKTKPRDDRTVILQ